MINDLFLINWDDLQSYYPSWSKNIDPKIIKFPVLITQDYYLKPILGEDFYKDFMDKFRDKGIVPLSTEYELLYNSYLKPLVVFGVLEESIFQLHNGVYAGGVMTKTAEYSNNAPDTTVFKLQYKYKDYREKYEKSLFNFLDNNRSDYPLFKKGKCDVPEKYYFLDFQFERRPIR
jgi:TRAP-type C4-dicarboxylate transport system substrate-binding protein